MYGAAILTAGVVIMKILGFIYKVPIGNIIGDDGYSMFLATYNIYNVFLTLATAGLPIALSRMISEANAEGRPMQAKRTFSVAWWTFFVVGLVCTLIMFCFPGQLADGVLHNPDAAPSIRAMAPAVLLVCLVSAYRGYCQGFGNMIPTTVGQVLEVLVEGHTDEGMPYGRSYRQADDVDDNVYIEDDTTSKVGDMVKVRILQGFTEDLVGELADV